MAVAAATALRGRVRSQHRVWALPRGCWRLVVLLGLSWVALLLLGGTAHAAPSDHRDKPAAPAAASEPGALPLLGKVLSNVGQVTDLATTTVQNLGPRDAATASPLDQAVSAATTTVASVTETAAGATASAAGAAPTELPVVSGLDVVAGVAQTVGSTADATAAGDKLLDVQLPSVTSTVAPVLSAAAAQLDQAAALIDTVGDLTVRLPLARPLTGALGTLAGTIEGASTVLTSTTYAVTDAADGVLDIAADTLAPLLGAATGPAGAIGVSGPGGNAGPTTTAPQPGTLPAVAAADAAPFAPAAVDASRAIGDGLATGGPAVPPPDATTDLPQLAVQPAADIVTTVPVPVSGAGSTSGSGGSTPAPTLTQTLVRVESTPTVEFEPAEPIEGPAGPMPGTPSADPAFSPD